MKRDVREVFSIGADGYSLSRSNGSAQAQRVSLKDVGLKEGAKAADGKGKDDGGPKLNIEAGVLFGLTDATQDRVFKLKGAVTF